MDYITVGDYVVLAFQAPFSGVFGPLLAIIRNKVVIADDFSTDKAFLEVGVDLTGSLWGGRADRDGPGAHFFHSGGEVGVQVKQVVATANNAVQARLIHAQIFQEFGFLVVVQFSDFGFQLITDGHDYGIFFGGDFTHGVEVGVVFKAFFVNVGDVHGGLEGQQGQFFELLGLIVIQGKAAKGLGFVEVRQDLFHQGFHLDGVFVLAFGGFGEALQGFLAGFQISQSQFGVDHIDIFGGVDLAFNVNHVLVFKAANHMGDRIGLTDIGEEFVTKAFTLGGASYQASNIDKFHGGRNHALRLNEFGQLVLTWVGNSYGTLVGFNGAEREIFCRDTVFGQRVKQGGFTYVR